MTSKEIKASFDKLKFERAHNQVLKNLNERCEERFKMLLPTKEEVLLMDEIYNQINGIVSTALPLIGIPKFKLLLYGSTVNGLALRNDSDLDLSLFIPSELGTFLDAP